MIFKVYILILLFSKLFSYSDNPPNQLTGLGAQMDCALCHSALINPSIGGIEVSGIPNLITPGETYRLQLKLKNNLASSWGFQITSVIGYYSDTGGVGNPFISAGSFDLVDSQLTISSVTDDLTYVKQTLDGSFSGVLDSVSWEIDWTAPEDYFGAVTFGISSVAGNSDMGNLGDYVYTDSFSRESIFEYPEPENVDYYSEVQPILNYYCLGCHNYNEQYNNNGLILENYETLMQGGPSSSTIIPGSPENSILYRILNGNIPEYSLSYMPYFGLQLDESLKEIIYTWIREGAYEQAVCNSGDVNQDSQINIQDIVIIVSSILDSILADNLSCSDLNEDGLLNVLDIIEIINIIID